MCGFCWCRCGSGSFYPSIDIAAFFSLFYRSFKILGRAIFGINDFSPNFGVHPLSWLISIINFPSPGLGQVFEGVSLWVPSYLPAMQQGGLGCGFVMVTADVPGAGAVVPPVE